MKKIAFVLIFSILSVKSIAQIKNDDVAFNIGTSPSTESELSLFLSKNISKKILKNAVFPPNKNYISASFNLNDAREIYNFVSTNRNAILEEELKKQVSLFFKEKLSSSNSYTQTKYSIQLISEKNSKNIINASDSFMEETNATCEPCKEYTHYEDIKKCFKLELEKHFNKNFDFEALENKKDELTIPLKINEKGEISYIPSKETKKNYTADVLKTTNTFPYSIEPGTLNKIAIETTQNIQISFNAEKKLIAEKDSITNSKSSNQLSHYFQIHLNEADLQLASLNTMNDQLIISFFLDKNKKPVNLKTNARSIDLDNKIIYLFQQSQIDTELYSETGPLCQFHATILAFENNKTIVKCDPIFKFERIPVYNGCEKSNSIADARECLNTKINEHISRNFDVRVASKTKLNPGTYRLSCMFFINKEGEIVDIQIKAPNEKIKEEAERVIKKIPVFKKPAMRNGKPVTAKYSLPIVFKFDDKNYFPSTSNNSNFKNKY